MVLYPAGMFLFFRRQRIHYEFVAGELREVTQSGTIRWREALKGLQSCERRGGWRSPIASLKLQWPGRERTIELLGSLDSAIRKNANDI